MFLKSRLLQLPLCIVHHILNILRHLLQKLFLEIRNVFLEAHGYLSVSFQSSATGIAQGSTANITVLASVTGVVPAAGPPGLTTRVVVTGLNLATAAGITAPAGITATITNAAVDGTSLNVDIAVGAGVTIGAKTLTLLTPSGNVDFTFTVADQ